MLLNTQPREVLSNIIQQLAITHENLLSVQAAIERSALGTRFHEDEIVNLQKLDHATQFVDAITLILQNLVTVTPWEKNTEITLEDVLNNVRLGNIRGVFLKQEKDTHSPVGEIDFF